MIIFYPITPISFLKINTHPCLRIGTFPTSFSDRMFVKHSVHITTNFNEVKQFSKLNIKCLFAMKKLFLDRR